MFTVQEILQEHKVEFLESGHHHNREGWLQLHKCPFCGSDRYHLGYNITANYSSCWRCGYHSAWSLFRKLGLPQEDCQHILKHTRAPKRSKDETGTLVEPTMRGPLLKKHREFLLDRGLDPDAAIKLWSAEGIALHPHLAWRLYLPIVQQGKRVSWTTRAVGNSEQRYISASSKEEAVNHKRVVYGLDYVRDTAVVVEGPLDAWKIGPGAVAMFGLVWTPAQLRALANVPRRFICFDNEPRAQAAARKLAADLGTLPGSTWVLQVDAKDPGAASRKEIQIIRRSTGLGVV